MLIPPFTGVFAARRGHALDRKFHAAARITLHAFGIGMALSLVIGIGIGVLMGAHPGRRPLIGMWVNIFESSPLTAIIPALMAVLGFGLTTMIVTVFLFSVWVIALDTQVGVAPDQPVAGRDGALVRRRAPQAVQQDPCARRPAGDIGRHPPRA